MWVCVLAGDAAAEDAALAAVAAVAAALAALAAHAAHAGAHAAAQPSAAVIPGSVVDLGGRSSVLRGARRRLGVDPLGGG